MNKSIKDLFARDVVKGKGSYSSKAVWAVKYKWFTVSKTMHMGGDPNLLLPPHLPPLFN